MGTATQSVNARAARLKIDVSTGGADTEDAGFAPSPLTGGTMYGTVFRMRALPGKEQALLELGERWSRERAPRTPGYIGEYIFRTDADPREIIGTVLFESREAYTLNADDPEQNRWYQEFRALLETDPEWNDGEVVYSWPPGLGSS
jgi:heme-degrading monooxygenase HmoA